MRFIADERGVEGGEGEAAGGTETRDSGDADLPLSGRDVHALTGGWNGLGSGLLSSDGWRVFGSSSLSSFLGRSKSMVPSLDNTGVSAVSASGVFVCLFSFDDELGWSFFSSVVKIKDLFLTRQP